MSSLVTNLNSSTAQEIVNWVTTADGRIHSADTTQLDFTVGKFVHTRRDCRQLVANYTYTADATQLDSWWCVLGISASYCTLTLSRTMHQYDCRRLRSSSADVVRLRK